MNVIIPPTPQPPPQTPPHPRQGLCSQGNAEDKRRSGCLLCVCGRMCRCVGEHSNSVASPVICKANECYHPTHPPNPPPKKPPKTPHQSVFQIDPYRTPLCSKMTLNGHFLVCSKMTLIVCSKMTRVPMYQQGGI